VVPQKKGIASSEDIAAATTLAYDAAETASHVGSAKRKPNARPSHVFGWPKSARSVDHHELPSPIAGSVVFNP